jgi:hypothetical protein
MEALASNEATIAALMLTRYPSAATGAWIIHVFLILLGKILVDVVPGMEQDASWTVVNLGYIAVSRQIR